MNPASKEAGVGPARPSIGLAMIVRNEQSVIARCLASVEGLVDEWLVVDTGSTDATAQLVRDALAALPGRLVERPWVDFGTNRTELVELAREHLSTDFLLLLDADMTIEVGPDFARELGAVNDAVNALAVRVGRDFEYRMPYLVRRDREWRFVGRTHEYLAGPGADSHEEFDGLRIVHHADGANRVDKFERDLRLLRLELDDEPDDPRATFYLAQTLRDLGRAEEAIEAYARRALLGGWEEEVFWSLFQIAEITASVRRANATDLYLAAWDFRPTRAEPLHRLARRQREVNCHATAHHFAELGMSLPPTRDLLFVERWVERWGLRFEWSVAAWWLGDVAGALRACDELLARTDLDASHREAVEANRLVCLSATPRHHAPRPD